MSDFNHYSNGKPK